MISSAISPDLDSANFVEVIPMVQTKIAKIYGAGGLRGMESYQSGIVISSDGHVLTVWSYVLDDETVTVVLDNGRRLEATVVGADPITEIAVLKFDPEDVPIAYFDLFGDARTPYVGTRVLAFSNLFGIATGSESASVLHGSISAVAPLEARRGAFSARFRGDVYIVDAMTNNPGAAGGALTDTAGRLIGLLGKEVRSQQMNTWLNFALPTATVATIADDIIAGRYTPPPLDAINAPRDPLTLRALGIILVPNVVARTPPFVDRVLLDSPADRVGLAADDLVVHVDGRPVNSCQEFTTFISRKEHDSGVVLSVLRDGELVEFSLGNSSRDNGDDR